MKRAFPAIRRPFAWSLVFSIISILLIQAGIFFFRHGASNRATLLIGTGLLLILLEIIFFVPVLYRRAVQNTSFPFLFRITAAGFLYIGFIFFIALAAINTGNNLLYLIVAFMISAITVSGVISRISLNRLKLSVDYQDSIFAAEYTTGRLRIENQKRLLASFSLGLEGYLINRTWLLQEGLPLEIRNRRQESGLLTAGVPHCRTQAFFPYIRAGQSGTEVFKVSFPARGIYHISHLDISTGFPFGFFRKGRRMAVSGDLSVFPELLEREELSSCLESQTGLLPILRRGLGGDLYTLREYSPGEDVRHMHWKATARAGRYIVKEFSPENIPTFFFLLDETAPEVSPVTKAIYERTISILATLAVQLKERGRSVVLRLSHGRDTSLRPREDLPGLLGELASTWLRPAPADPAGHPFNTGDFSEAALAMPACCITLCSFHPLAYFDLIGPLVDNLLDMNRL